MMILKEGPRQSDFCQLVGLLSGYLERHRDDTDAIQRLRDVLTDEKGLWDTQDVQSYTGWCRQYVSTLCSQGRIPFIPGRPNKFIPASVKAAISDMQVGAGYGRRKSALKTTKGRK